MMINSFKDRSPVLRRQSAGYMVVTLISFAVSVSGTRLFLTLTGFPQLGGEGLHIAHVLWGGLFLFIAALLPVIFVNEWIMPLSALISGFGIGLFIDEVGKFITANNDYFYPSAAPIIYVFFLVVVLFSFQIRKRRELTNRARMYNILEEFSEVLDHDLSTDEYNELMAELDTVIQLEKSKSMVDLATSLKKYLEENRMNVVPRDPMIFDRIRMNLKKLEKQWLHQKRLASILIIGFLLMAVWDFLAPLGYALVTSNIDTPQILREVIRSNMVMDAGGLTWFQVRVVMEGTIGLLAVVTAVCFIAKRYTSGYWSGFIGLLLKLTVINPLVFYFDQFSTIVVAALEFLLFILLLRYRKRFMQDQNQAVQARDRATE